MLKKCFIKAINYTDFEDVTDVDNEFKEFQEKKGKTSHEKELPGRGPQGTFLAYYYSLSL